MVRQRQEENNFVKMDEDFGRWQGRYCIKGQRAEIILESIPGYGDVQILLQNGKTLFVDVNLLLVLSYLSTLHLHLNLYTVESIRGTIQIPNNRFVVSDSLSRLFTINSTKAFPSITSMPFSSANALTSSDTIALVIKYPSYPSY